MDRIARGIREGETCWFTLTSPPGEDFVTSYGEFQVRWHRVVERIRRRTGCFDFVAVIEPQLRGAAHVHVVYRGRLLGARWLSLAASSSGFGAAVHVAPVLNTGVARYLAKSLTAEILDPAVTPPPFFQRVRFSRHWTDVTPKRRPTRWTAWYIANAPPERAALSAIARGYEVVEFVGGGPPRGSALDRFVDWYRDLRTCLVARRREVLA